MRKSLAGMAALSAAALAGLLIGCSNGDQASTPTPTSAPATSHVGWAVNPAVHVTLQPDGTQILGTADAPKTLDMFEDPLCPACGRVEQVYGAKLAEAVDNGKISIRYHLLNFLNRSSSSGDYSTRAGAAFRCVAHTNDGVAYSKLHSLLFTTKQPEEGGTDHSNDQLAALAKEAGATDEAVTCVKSGAQVKAAADAAKTATGTLEAKGQVSTPSIFAGGTKIDPSDPDWITKAAG